MDKPYNQIDHEHCWNQPQPPACGIKTEHKVCCLCEVPKEDKDWSLAFDKLMSEEGTVKIKTIIFQDDKHSLTTIIDSEKIREFIRTQKALSKAEGLRRAAEIVRSHRLSDWSEEAKVYDEVEEIAVKILKELSNE